MLDRKVKMQKVKELRDRGESADVDTVKLTPDEYDKYLKMAYEQAKFQKPRNFLGLTKSLPPDEMKKLMLANTDVTDADLKELANARALAVRRFLGQAGGSNPAGGGCTQTRRRRYCRQRQDHARGPGDRLNELRPNARTWCRSVAAIIWRVGDDRWRRRGRRRRLTLSGAPDREFSAMVARFIDSEMRLFPESATDDGDHRYDGRLTDMSQVGDTGQNPSRARMESALFALACRLSAAQ